MTDDLYLPMVNCLTIGTDGTDGQCFGGLPYAIAIMLTTSFTDGLFKFTDGEFISPSVQMDNLYLPMVICLTIGTDGTDGQCFRGLPYAIALMLTISFTDGLFKFTDGKFIYPSVPANSPYLPMVNCLTIGSDGQSFGGIPNAIAIMLTTSFTDGHFKFTDGKFMFPSVATDNLYLPMVNCLAIGTYATDGQSFGWLPYSIAIMLTTAFTDGLFKFTDGELIYPSVPTNNPYLPMVNCLTIGSDGQSFGGIPNAIAIMLTTSFTDGHFKFTD
ncbi:Hypothetical predicted protein, partial [Paramuricea clavata]